MEQINIRVGDLTLRNTTKNGMEIVRWHEGDASCYMIAHWTKTNDGANDVHFIGNRFLSVNKEAFWVLLKMGQDLLDNPIQF
jgi:hypothetical protein